MMDPTPEGAEPDYRTGEDEPLAQTDERDEVVGVLRELPRTLDRRLTEREVGVGGGHRARCA
jgi:hypothetical protein